MVYVGCRVGDRADGWRSSPAVAVPFRLGSASDKVGERKRRIAGSMSYGGLHQQWRLPDLWTG
jgi:hypothetical protein